MSKPGAHYYITNEIPTPRTQTKSSLFIIFLSLSSFFFLFLVGSLRLDTPHVTVGLLQHSQFLPGGGWRGFRVVPCQMQRFTGRYFRLLLAMTSQPRSQKAKEEEGKIGGGMTEYNKKGGENDVRRREARIPAVYSRSRLFLKVCREE